MRIAQIRREGQVLDRSPRGVGTDDREVEVRITSRTSERDSSEVAADHRLARIAVLELSIRTVDAARPVLVPVVGITTPEAPGLDGIDAGTGAEDAVSKTGETGALVAAAATAEHEEALREQALEIVASCAIRVDSLQVDGVASSGRDVLDGQRTLNRPAPLVGRMTGGLSRAVVGGMELMRDSRDLGQTPGLVDADLTDDVGGTRATPIVGAVGARHERSAGSSRRRERRVPEVRLAIIRRRLVLQRHRSGDALA